MNHILSDHSAGKYRRSILSTVAQVQNRPASWYLDRGRRLLDRETTRSLWPTVPSVQTAFLSYLMSFQKLKKQWVRPPLVFHFLFQQLPPGRPTRQTHSFVVPTVIRCYNAFVHTLFLISIDGCRMGTDRSDQPQRQDPTMRGM